MNGRSVATPHLLLLLAACAAGADQRSAANERPNFVIILADDMGDAGLSCTGNPHFVTPHLDRLARQGLRFTDFHSSGAVCSPTRAGLLTGRYQQRTGVDAVVNADPAHPDHDDALPLDEITFAEALREHGYATGIFGKWHVGYAAAANPVHQGFDEFRGFVSGNIDYHSHRDRMGTPDWWHGAERVAEAGYTTHLIHQHALRFITAHRDQPFCLYLPHAAIHDPNQGPDDPPIRGPDKRPRAELSPIDVAVEQMTLAVDDGTGAILDKLAELGLDERTVVVFLSDNGGTRQNRSTGVNVRGFKGSLWEGGHLVPAIFRWPGRIAAGTTTAATAISIDLLPTLLALAGAAPLGDRVLDGVDLSPLLLGAAELPERDLFWQHGAASAMRRGPWKMLRTRSNTRLFDLVRDPGERDDLAARHPERTAAMTAALAAWQREVRPGTDR